MDSLEGPKGILQFIEDCGTHRHSLVYEIDGIIIKVDSFALHPALGLTLLEPVFTLSWPAPDMLGWTMVSFLPFLPEAWRETTLEKIGGVEKESVSFQDDPMARMIAAGLAPIRRPVGGGLCA